MEYLGFLARACENFLAWRASLSLPDSKSKMSLNSHLKYRTVVSFPPMRCVISLRRRLLLLPVYMIDLLALASSYAPSFAGRLSKFSRVNLRHLDFIGIFHPLFMIDATHRLAYPLGQKLEGIANDGRIHEDNNRHGG